MGRAGTSCFGTYVSPEIFQSVFDVGRNSGWNFLST
jgi:hypothetical protein